MESFFIMTWRNTRGKNIRLAKHNNELNIKLRISPEVLNRGYL